MEETMDKETRRTGTIKAQPDKSRSVTVVVLGIILISLLAVLLVELYRSSSASAKGVVDEPMLKASVETSETSELVLYSQSSEGNATQQIEYSLGLRENVEGGRDFGSIHTALFEVYNVNTNQASKLTDGDMSLETISNVLSGYLNEHKYKTISVGLVDNTFYIQQDTSVEMDGNFVANIVSLKDGFTAEDWFSLTEAIYKNTDIQADSLFAYNTNFGNKHYIYVHIEPTKTEEAVGPSGAVEALEGQGDEGQKEAEASNKTGADTAENQ